MLIGHPERYTDTELCEWIEGLVDKAVPENRRLDYKASPGERRQEWAKDITSFANELGGVLVYGIPEDSQNAESTPVPGRPYGIDPISGFEQDLENVYSSAITPLLPSYHIRKVQLSQYPDKVCYLVWTPESWAGPHMVSAYQDNRFYRRGEFRAIIMTERDVEERYRRRLELRGAAEQFIESEDAWHNYWTFLEGTPTTTLMVIPHLLIPNRILFHEPTVRTWLQNLRLLGSWLPSMHGVSVKQGSNEDQEIVEMYRNGAVIAHHCTCGKIEEESRGFRIAHGHEFYTWQQWLEVARQLYQHISYDGPVSISVVLQRAKMNDLVTFSLEEHGPFMLPYGGWSSRWSTLPERRIQFRIDSSAAELDLRRNKVLREAADALYRAFGMWQADCFDEQDQLV